MADTDEIAHKIGKSAGNRGKGRPKGSVNKVTSDVKAMILGALNEKGGQAYLVQQAEENPVAFMSLVGRVLPMTLKGDGENGEIIFRTVYEAK